VCLLRSPWRLQFARPQPLVNLSGGVSLPGLAREFIAFNTRRHCLGLLAQALGFLTQTWGKG